MDQSTPSKRPATASGSMTWRWLLGMLCVVTVALIWITASFVVQSVVDSGVSPFLITYICNSLFMVYIPIVEGEHALRRFFQRRGGWSQLNEKFGHKGGKDLTLANDIDGFDGSERSELGHTPERHGEISSPQSRLDNEMSVDNNNSEIDQTASFRGHDEEELDVSGNNTSKRWSRKRTAMTGLIICPFWFLAQFTFNLSLKYTTVTSNTILSTTSSIFTFLVSLQFLGETFTWLKLGSVLLCMAGTIVVSLGDTWRGKAEHASHPLIGDIVCLASAMFYATYTALIRVKISDEDDEKGNVSTALVFGFLGLFNALLLSPVAVILHITGLEPFHRLTMKQIGLIMAKGLFDNVLSDYLWARAVLLTTPTAATAGLSIQVPIAAVVDALQGVIPSIMDILGGCTILVGFLGINWANTPGQSSPEGKEQNSLEENEQSSLEENVENEGLLTDR